MTARAENSSGRPRILFVYADDASFVRTDLALLRSFSKVTPFLFEGKRSYPALFSWVLRSDIVVSWFTMGFSLAANIVGRVSRTKSMLIAGGWDVVGMPEIGYGCLLTEYGILRARLALSTADRVLAFSKWSEDAIRKVAPKSRVRTEYLGVDVSRFRPGSKEDLVICVANVNRENLLRKGLRAFVSASNLVPEARFVLVGRVGDSSANELRGLAGPNLSITGWLPDNELRDLMGRARVCAQPSYTEGFGVALAEAMASGCVPVVTRVGAIPEVVGETGFYVRYNDVNGLADAIRCALVSSRGWEGRERVERLFSLDRRRLGLRSAVDELWEGNA